MYNINHYCSEYLKTANQAVEEKGPLVATILSGLCLTAIGALAALSFQSSTTPLLQSVKLFGGLASISTGVVMTLLAIKTLNQKDMEIECDGTFKLKDGDVKNVDINGDE